MFKVLFVIFIIFLRQKKAKRGGDDVSKGIYETKVNATIQEVWNFISELSSWAHLIPGYIEHEMINQNVSNWKLAIDLGFIKKKTRAEVEIKEMTEPSKISFRFIGLNQNYSGEGYFKAKKLNDSTTLISVYLKFQVVRSLAQLMKPKLDKLVPKLTREVTESVRKEIEKGAV